MADKLLGYNIAFRFKPVLDKGLLIVNTINPHSYYTAKHDPIFSKALQTSDVLLPDGIGIVLAYRWLTGKKINRITGADAHKKLLELADKKSLPVFYLGSSQLTLNLIRKKLDLEHPDVKAGFFSPPYKAEFSYSDNLEMIRQINEFKPDILFVGMTAPKQEKWVLQHKDVLNVAVVCSIGAVFDFYAGTVQRPGKLWQIMGLEWLIRWVKEPLRLYKRNMISMPFFLLDVFKAKIGSNR